MKKNILFGSLLLIAGILLFLLKFTGIPAHIVISIVGALVLGAWTALTKKHWKIPALEIVMRVLYGIALISGIVIMNVDNIAALAIVHKASAALSIVLVAVLLVHGLITSKKGKN